MRNLLIFALLVFLAGCTAEIKATPEADALYNQAKQALAEGDYIAVSEKLTLLKEEYPFSPLAVDAELLLADAEFAKEQYQASAAKYAAFADFHPFHKDVDYALYRQALAYSKLIDSVDRDQANSKLALRSVNKLMETRPDTKYKTDAEAVKNAAREALAGHELYVAEFYLRKDQPLAAKERILGIFRDYPGTAAESEGLKLLVKVEMAIKGQGGDDGK